MGIILNYIERTSEGRVKAYDTQRRFLDDYDHDTFGEFDDHKNDFQPKDKATVYAESKPSKSDQIPISEKDINNRRNNSLFKFFMDGTRHVYKVGDIAIDGVVYPLAVGQIIVGYCGREGRDIKVGEYRRILVLAVPVEYDTNHQGVNFFRHKCEELNAAIRETPLFSKFGIQLDSVIPYGRTGESQTELGRNKYLRLAVARIQNEMLDQERILVNDLVMSAKISDDNEMLIKDGSIEYKKDFTNRPDEMALSSSIFSSNFQFVIGVSKMFDPELLSKREPRIGTIIAELKPHCRTNAYQYHHEGKIYCVWYIRLRDTINRPNRYADIIKVEMIMKEGEKIKQTSLVNSISAHLINEAYPVCYGNDARWANHLYPVYVTERYCKSMFIDEKLIIRMI